jgi:L-alanine-DL-glutamate epimerase-like enolase superfamily enzyme
VPREDWEGLGRLAREAGIPVAADESCRSARDALRIARNGLAQVINIKLAKCGVVEALAIAAIAKAAGLGLMIGGMVETRLAMGFGAHFAAGLGGFNWVDLDTPLLLTRDPVRGGYVASGARYDLDVGTAGHGGMLEW